MYTREHMRGRLDDLIRKGHEALHTKEYVLEGFRQLLDPHLAVGWQTQSYVCLVNFLGKTNEYTVSFQAVTSSPQDPNGARAGVGILEAIKEDIDNGYLQSYRQLIEADLLGGLMGQAEYLLKNGYLVAAAAVAGAALQQALEELVKRHHLKLKNREDLNSLGDKLFQSEILNGIERKQLSLIAGVRNSADHGKTEELTNENVGGMVRDAVNFLAKHVT